MNASRTALRLYSSSYSSRNFYRVSLLPCSQATWIQKKTFTSSSCNMSPLSSGKSSKKTRGWGLLGGFLAGFAGAAGYWYYTYSEDRSKAPIANFPEDTHQFSLLQEPPPTRIVRSVPGFDNEQAIKLTLYQYHPCPFCCKVRAYLDYAGLAYDVVEVNPVSKKELKWSSYRKVPYLIASMEEEGKTRRLQLVDSSLIISTLASFQHTQGKKDGDQLAELLKYYPFVKYHDGDAEKTEIMNKYFLMYGDDVSTHQSKEQQEKERKWRKWADDVLVHMLSPNVYRTWEEALETFHMFSIKGDYESLFSAWEKWMVIHVGAAAMYIIGKRLKKRHGIFGDEREALYQSVNQWLRAIRTQNKGPFMGGEQPDLSDLAVYGLLASIDGTRAFEDLEQNTKIRTWYDKVKAAVETRSGAKYLQIRPPYRQIVVYARPLHDLQSSDVCCTKRNQFM
nr:EOG090X08KD [Triops cancriformis]